MNAVTHRRFPARRGITVLEVLISIGILAIGLSSVLGILAAARTQAARAVVLDRAALHASNVLADAATFGLLRSGVDWFWARQPESWPAGDVSYMIGTSGTNDPEDLAAWSFQIPASRPSTLVFDVDHDPNVSGNKRVLQNSVSARPRSGNLYGFGPESTQRLESMGRLGDDILVEESPASKDDPPLNAMNDNGVRESEGVYSSLLCLTGTEPGPYLASVVVFYKRLGVQVGQGGYQNQEIPQVMGTMVSGTLTVPTMHLRNRQLAEIVRPGAVAWVPSTVPGAPGTFHQLTGVSFIGTGSSSGPFGSTTARLFLASNKERALCAGPGPFTIQFLADSVGLVEQPFVPESAGAFTQ